MADLVLKSKMLKEVMPNSEGHPLSHPVTKKQALAKGDTTQPCTTFMSPFPQILGCAESGVQVEQWAQGFHAKLLWVGTECHFVAGRRHESEASAFDDQDTEGRWGR